MMKKFIFFTIGIIVSISLTIEAQHVISYPSAAVTDPVEAFKNPPESAKPGVWWLWMGSNVTKEGITGDLEALKKEGVNTATIMHLADMVTPVGTEIGKSPTPEIISWTEPWWKLVRHAAEESKRLGMYLGMHNCPGYNCSGGPWITPELAMQRICWSEQIVAGNSHVSIKLKRPTVNPGAQINIINRETGSVETLDIPEIKSYYKDIAVIAVPANGVITQSSVINITNNMQPNGQIEWVAPKGDWTIYRFGHTAMGSVNFPAQRQATGFECDKMSQEAVTFHIEHVRSEIQKHLGDLVGTVFTHVLFDSYEAGVPTWTPKMKEEFLNRRGYDLTPYLIIFAGRNIGSIKDSLKFRNDFDATIKDLYRDVYYTIMSKKLHEANLTFTCEPYACPTLDCGPFRNNEVLPLIHSVMVEFWTHGGSYYAPFEYPTKAAIREAGHNIISAEAFTGQPMESKWTETPAWLKFIGDGAFCDGVNFFFLSTFVHQPWGDRFKPGVTFGLWGTHFYRTQTWWKPGEAMVKYWQRCQALLQWGQISKKSGDDFISVIIKGNPEIKFIHRNMGGTDIYFVANTSHNAGIATCRFSISGMQPELWDPVTGTMRNLPVFEDSNNKISIPLKFDDAQSFFIVFRNKTRLTNTARKSNFPSTKEVLTINGQWQVTFDSIWGGPPKPVTFTVLEDWTIRPEKGIKYYSGTATYKTGFNVPSRNITSKESVVYLDLGVVKHIARIKLNNKDLGVVWTAPWSIKLPPSLLLKKGNKLEIEVTNVWANRLIGDEQEPADCEWFPGYPAYNAGVYLKEFPDWFLKNQPRPSKKKILFYYMELFYQRFTIG